MNNKVKAICTESDVRLQSKITEIILARRKERKRKKAVIGLVTVGTAMGVSRSCLLRPLR